MELGMVARAALNAQWTDALLLEGERCLIESSVRELTEYFGMSRVDVLEACVTAQQEARREWEADPRDTIHDVEAFYRTTRSCLFENVWTQATEPASGVLNASLLAYAQQIGALEVLDFGAGAGSTALLLARHGFNVTLADLSPMMLAFARWRFARRGLSAEFIDLNQQPLPQNRYAFVTAVDVLERLYDPAVELQQLSEALVLNGVLAFNLHAQPEPQYPMRVMQSGAPLLRALRAHGLRNIQGADPVADCLREQGVVTAQRVAHSRVRNWSNRAMDLVWSTERRQEWWGRGLV